MLYNKRLSSLPHAQTESKHSPKKREHAPRSGWLGLRRSARRRRRLAKTLLFLLSLFLFILAITLMKDGAASLTPLVRDRLHVNTPLRSLGFGWLFAYLVLSGSPVAAAALTLISMSVSISLGILVPLSQRGFIRRENVIPYTMGCYGPPCNRFVAFLSLFCRLACDILVVGRFILSPDRSAFTAEKRRAFMSTLMRTWPVPYRTLLCALIAAMAALLLFGWAPASGAPPAPQSPDDPDCDSPKTPQVECVQATIDGRMTNETPYDTTPGALLVWDILIRNPSDDVDLKNVEVTAVATSPLDEDIDINCSQDRLRHQQTMDCEAELTAAETQEQIHDIQFIVQADAEESSNTDQHISPACLVRYRTLQICRPDIDLEQYTNDFDADVEPGPYIAPGDPVTWTFEVRNTGDTPLVDVRITDDVLGEICVIPLLEVGAVETCERVGVAQPGLFANLSTVTAVAQGCDETVSDTDPCHYFNCAVDIEKSTNGEDADVEPYPSIPVGDPVTWRYVVTNSGGVPLEGLMVTDDKLGEICQEDTLEPEASFECSVEEIVDGSGLVGGVYTNLATVEGYAWTALCADEDPSHYTLAEESIPLLSMTKLPLPWTYIVSNTGEMTLADVVLTTDADVTEPYECASTPPTPVPPGATLPPNGVWCYDAEPGSRLGFGGAASVVAISTPNALSVSDALSTIPYDGLTVQLYLGEVEVLFDGPAIRIPAGETTTWRYVISNDTGYDLSNLRLWHASMVRDAAYEPVCVRPSLAAGASLECPHTETAREGFVYIVGSVDAEATIDNDVTLLSRDIIRSYVGELPALPGHITGRAFRDAQPANGRQDPHEEGLAGVAVQLIHAEGVVIDETVTDAQGQYVFEVAPGAYRLRFEQAGAVWCKAGGCANHCLDSDVDPATGLTDWIEVDSGSIERCWDAGMAGPRQLLPFVER